MPAPVGRRMRRGLVGQGNDAIDGLGRQGRDARGPGLVAGEPLDPLMHEATYVSPLPSQRHWWCPTSHRWYPDVFACAVPWSR